MVSILFSGVYEVYNHDNLGNLLSKVDCKGQTTTYYYDALNRLTRKYYQDGSDVNFTYDALGRLTQAVDATGTYGLSYDNLGRLTGTSTQYSFLSGQTFTNAYAYDAAGNRTSFTGPSNSTTDYVYDTLNRLTSLTAPQSQQFSFSYDNLGRRAQLTRPNGVTTAYTYDSLSRLLSVLHQSGGTTIDGATYAVDAVGNRTAKTNQLSNSTENYSYDAIYQLTQVVKDAAASEFYNYDKVGNRTASQLSAAYSVISSNQLTATTTAAYTYDSNGNTLSKTEGGNTTGYTWDPENRLTQVTLPDTSTVSFKYDPFGRRIYKSSVAGTTIYLFDGAGIVEERDASGTLLAGYTQGAGIDEPLAMQRGTTYFYQQDGLGSITSLTDSTGAVTATYQYDSYGNLSNTTGSVQNPFRYTAREWDGETGFYYYRARYYDSRPGRFVSEDPIQGSGGLNFYEYAKNNSTNLFDPSGLLPKPVRPFRWRYCTGTEVAQCKQICAFQGKKYESCRVSQRYRIGPQGWSIGPDWVDGPLSCSCSDKSECKKASEADPKATENFKYLFIGVGIGIGLALAPELTLPSLPVLVPELVHAFAH
jgi:RHS repeat-associated protein